MTKKLFVDRVLDYMKDGGGVQLISDHAWDMITLYDKLRGITDVETRAACYGKLSAEPELEFIMKLIDGIYDAIAEDVE